MKCKLSQILTKIKKTSPKTLLLIAIAFTGGSVSPEALTTLINIFTAV